MAKKEKKIPAKSPKKQMASEIEGRISDSLKDFPKRTSDKKYQKKIHKASKILVKTLALKPVKVSPKKGSKKSKKSTPDPKAEAVS